MELRGTRRMLQDTIGIPCTVLCHDTEQHHTARKQLEITTQTLVEGGTVHMITK